MATCENCGGDALSKRFLLCARCSDLWRDGIIHPDTDRVLCVNSVEVEQAASIKAIKDLVKTGETQYRPVQGGTWTEVTRMLGGEVHQTSCCCKSPGQSRQDCMLKANHKNPCRCDCHRGIKRPKV